MSNITIKIEGLDQLTEAVALLASATAFKKDMENTTKAAAKIADKPTKAKTKKAKLTREDVRAALVAKNSPSTREQLKAILDKHNAPSISELDEKHFESVMQDLEAL